MKQYTFIFMVLLLLSGCSNHPSLPQDYKQESGKPDIYPDYTDVTVPVNIAPLNFMVEQADEVVAHFKAGDTEYNYGKGNKVLIPEDEWHKLLAAEFPLEAGIRHEMYIELEEKAVKVVIGDQIMTLRIENLAKEVYIGITGCEDINRFYNVKIDTR